MVLKVKKLQPFKFKQEPKSTPVQDISWLNCQRRAPQLRGLSNADQMNCKIIRWGCRSDEKRRYYITGLEWVHRWVNLHWSSGWLQMVGTSMSVEINWMADIQVAVCPSWVTACPGSQAAICLSQTARQLLHPGANLRSCTKELTASPINTESHSFTSKRTQWAGGLGGSGRSLEERGKGNGHSVQKLVYLWHGKDEQVRSPLTVRS